MAAEFLRPEPDGLVELALGRDAEGFPARITPSAIADLLGAGGLLDDVRLDPGPLPAALGAVELPPRVRRCRRGMARGARPGAPAVRRRARSRTQLDSHATGALFAGLALSRPFLERQLDLGSARAREHQRIIARVALLESRAQALRVLLRPAALAGQKAFAEAYEARLQQAIGVELPGTVAGALWRLHVDDAQRFDGAVARRWHTPSS